MDLRDLDYFRAIVAAGHIGRAADSLGLTQPALTKCVARLEHALDARLLERTPKGVHPTPFGVQLLRHANRAHTVMDDALRELAELRNGETGHVRIGTGNAIAQHLLPKVCASLLTTSPKLTLDITSGTGRGLVPALRDGQLDLVLTGVPIDHEPGLRDELILQDHVVVIARKSHPLQRRRSVSIADLARARWALSPSGSLLSDWLHQRWRDAAIAVPPPAVVSDSMATLLTIVAASDLLTFASWSTIRYSPLHALLRPLAGSTLTWRRRLGATYREGGLSAGRRPQAHRHAGRDGRARKSIVELILRSQRWCSRSKARDRGFKSYDRCR